MRWYKQDKMTTDNDAISQREREIERADLPTCPY